MPAYVIVEAEVQDEAIGLAYWKLAEPSIRQYGGHYLVATKPEVQEGDWPGRAIVLEFPNLDQARTWYDSPEYRAAREIRKTGVKVRLIFAEGMTAA
ncbi:DUF1330 domain-containing protein [Nocardia terpenica]|uniref:DUF1330 domain-containing protein n=1 Tax=Nocardia terpenica TaxID=455432 RepID=A0A164JR82_9NOCA|nr:DUF1330 domain-containing protein [Nocardia terpenica]KZM70649.1 hypothetical protein AWN90_39455 [Nocardia terpenica]NQE90094.1 DUF1330 domain-containing protein [Nocardia terpenica]